MNGLAVDVQKYKCLMEHNPDGVCEIDLQGQFLDANHVYEQLTGYSKSELLQLNFVDLMFADDVQSGENEREFLLQDRCRNNTRLQIRHKKGHRVQILCTTVPIVVDEKVIGFYIIAKDISKQETVEELLGSESMFAYSQRIAHVGSWEFDPVGQRSFWSAELFNIYGIPNTGYISLTEAAKYIHPEDRERFMNSAQALSDGQPYDIEFRII